MSFFAVNLIITGLALLTIALMIGIDGPHNWSRRSLAIVTLFALFPVINGLAWLVYVWSIASDLEMGRRFADWWKQPLIRKKS